MDEHGAEPGEMCPLCKTAMNTGAIVCTGCGASRMIGRGCLGILGFLLWILAFVVCVIGIFSFNSEGVLFGVVGGVAIAAVGLVILKLSRPRVVYRKSSDRR
jgi:hypothetical protein